MDLPNTIIIPQYDDTEYTRSTPVKIFNWLDFNFYLNLYIYQYYVHSFHKRLLCIIYFYNLCNTVVECLTYKFYTYLSFYDNCVKYIYIYILYTFMYTHQLDNRLWNCRTLHHTDIFHHTISRRRGSDIHSCKTLHSILCRNNP